MKINVKLFGLLSDMAGRNELSLEGIQDTASLREEFCNRYPSLRSTSFLIAVNKKVVRENCSLRQEDEIALLPPFSGG